MRALPAKLLRAVSDATIGTVIVMAHVVLAERERVRRGEKVAPRPKRLVM
jgi:hypothetical protein